MSKKSKGSIKLQLVTAQLVELLRGGKVVILTENEEDTIELALEEAEIPADKEEALEVIESEGEMLSDIQEDEKVDFCERDGEEDEEIEEEAENREEDEELV